MRKVNDCLAILAIAFLICSPIIVACQSTSRSAVPVRERASAMLERLRPIGDALIRTKGTEAIRKHAPEAVALIDSNANGIVTFAELDAFFDTTQDPDALVWLAIVVIELVDGKDAVEGSK